MFYNGTLQCALPTATWCGSFTLSLMLKCLISWTSFFLTLPAAWWWAGHIQLVGACLQETAAYRISYVGADERPEITTFNQNDTHQILIPVWHCCLFFVIWWKINTKFVIVLVVRTWQWLMNMIEYTVVFNTVLNDLKMYFKILCEGVSVHSLNIMTKCFVFHSSSFSL